MLKRVKRWHSNWSFIVVGGLIILSALFVIGCGSAVQGRSSNRDRALDPIQLIGADKGELVAVIDDFHIYKFIDGETVCYFAFEPANTTSTMSCLR